MKKTFILLLIFMMSMVFFVSPVYAIEDNTTIVEETLEDEDEEEDTDLEDDEEDEDENEDEEDDDSSTSSSNSCNPINENTVTTLYMGNYGNVPYCSGGDNIHSRGCYVVTLASILNSYGNSTSVSDIASYLCTNHKSEVTQHPPVYGSISANQEMHNHFNYEMEKIGNDFTTINNTLDDGSMVMLSITASSGCSGSAGHYIAIAMHNNDQYYVINTGPRAGCESGWYSKDRIELFLNNISQGPYEVYPTSCDKSLSGSSTSSSSKSLEKTTIDINYPKFNGGRGSCDTYRSFIDALNGFYTLMKIAAPVLVIVLSTIDYIKAIANSNGDEIKKCHKRTIKRIVVGLLVFFLPNLLDLLFKIFGLYDVSVCDIGM